MAELTADLFLSVDGFAAAGNAGPYFDLGGPELDAWIAAELAKPQVTLMGRVTYELLGALPGSPTAVASRTLTAPDVTVVDDVAAFKKDSALPIRSIGSISLVRSLLRDGLIDRLRLMIFPLTVGPDGREPAFAGHPRATMTLAATAVEDGRPAGVRTARCLAHALTFPVDRVLLWEIPPWRPPPSGIVLTFAGSGPGRPFLSSVNTPA